MSSRVRSPQISKPFRLPPVSPLLVLALVLSVSSGCVSPFQRIDADLARRAGDSVENPTWLVAFQEEEYFPEERRRAREESRPSVIVAELLAIFPGFLVHGLGHNYAGDHETARKLRNMGVWGYLFTALGGGILTGAFFLDESSDQILPISLYVAGGTTGAIGLGYFFTAWISDIYDTPRAVRSGGQPWRFLEDEDVFDD